MTRWKWKEIVSSNKTHMSEGWNLIERVMPATLAIKLPCDKTTPLSKTKEFCNVSITNHFMYGA